MKSEDMPKTPEDYDNLRKSLSWADVRPEDVDTGIKKDARACRAKYFVSALAMFANNLLSKDLKSTSDIC